MKNLNKIITFFAFIALIGCDNNSSVSESGNTGEMRLEDEAQALKYNTPPAAPLPVEQIERKFIKNGSIEFETEDLTKTRDDISNAIKKYNGYIASENDFKNSYEISSNITIRVPAEHFDNLIREIAIGVRKFDRKEIHVQDVTAEFLDIEARLKTKKELENRYLELLQKANSVSEILEVEKQIGELRSEIESVEGRLKYLKNQVSLSTLNVRIYEPISEHTEFGRKFRNGFKNGWENLILFFVLLVNIWPFIFITIAVLVLVRVLRRRK